jgi:hypothetical protein
MPDLTKKQSPEALEMLAKLMLLRAKRESPELFNRQVDYDCINGSEQIAKQLSLPLKMRVDE